MSFAGALARIDEIQRTLQPAPAPARAAVVAGSGQFGSALQSVLGTPASPLAPMAPAAGGTSAGAAVLAAVRGEVGVAEQPPGSNDAPRIAQYRQATAGSGVGPWCAYFVSWAARQAGAPIGDAGQGFGRVDDVWDWAQRTGKATPAAAGPPAPGDLVVWDEHIGVVESVDSDGSIHTIEGNSSDQVARRTYGADGGGAVGWVRLG
jgi:hypothetical protein